MSLRPLSDEEKAANWATVRKAGKFYFVALLLPFLALIWGAGYAQGLLDSCLPRVTVERNPE